MSRSKDTGLMNASDARYYAQRAIRHQGWPNAEVLRARRIWWKYIEDHAVKPPSDEFIRDAVAWCRGERNRILPPE